MADKLGLDAKLLEGPALKDAEQRGFYELGVSSSSWGTPVAGGFLFGKIPLKNIKNGLVPTQIRGKYGEHMGNIMFHGS